ncbi:MAG: hypothetical protein BGO69_05425 [Bacteroidetes bacterium 46-16]|nr:MAG: hypothetical protein BGO69_05425 [Bacteroidetes bacterium 46-16]
MEKDKHIGKEQLLGQLKVGLAFKKLMEENERLKTEGRGKPTLITSLGQLSSAADLRKATLSDLFTGNSNPKISTINVVLSALGKTFTDFARYMDAITESEAWNYHKELEKARTVRNRRGKKP